jgi:hypothetical protein
VGCIAGNAGVLTNDKVQWSRAEQHLSGGKPALAQALARLFYDTEVPAKYGTKKYARIVAQRITAFLKKHKTSLLAVRI